MSVINRVWLCKISENLASLSIESMFPDESKRIQVTEHSQKDNGEDIRHMIHLNKLSELDLWAIGKAIEKYLKEENNR